MRIEHLALALVLAPAAVVAQQPAARAVVEFDHATGTARLLMYRGASVDTTELGRDPSVRVKRSIPVEVRVVNTNTAIYRFKKESAVAASPEIASLRGFATSKLTPFLPGMPGGGGGGGGKSGGGKKGATGEAPTAEAISEARLALASALSPVEASLSRLDEAVYGTGGVQDINTRSLLALEEMRRGRPAEQAAAAVRQTVGISAPCQRERPLRLASTENVLRALTDLVSSSTALRNAMSGPVFDTDVMWRTLHDSAQTMDRRAQTIISDFDRIVDDAYHVERLAAIVANACSYWSAGVVPVTRTSGRTITVSIEPRNEPETIRLADRGTAKYSVEVIPSTFLRPAIGLGAVAVPDGRYPTYEAKPASGSFQIIESGSTDSRFSPSGSLALTWPWLDARETKGFALWLPEIVATGGGVRGVGVGAGLSWNFLKLGAGALWIHHKALDGQKAGDVIADRTLLRITERYGPPKLYVSLSVFDWAPFANKIPQ